MCRVCRSEYWLVNFGTSSAAVEVPVPYMSHVSCLGVCVCGVCGVCVVCVWHVRSVYTSACLPPLVLLWKYLYPTCLGVRVCGACGVCVVCMWYVRGSVWCFVCCVYGV